MEAGITGRDVRKGPRPDLVNVTATVIILANGEFKFAPIHQLHISIGSRKQPADDSADSADKTAATTATGHQIIARRDDRPVHTKVVDHRGVSTAVKIPNDVGY